MFQLIYLRFTQPRPTRRLFGVMTSQTKAMLANQDATPGVRVRARRSKSTLYQNHPRRAPDDRRHRWIEMNLDKSFAFYKDRFADASDFTFVFVGSFDSPTMKPLVERYLGGLPSHPPEGDVEGRRRADADRRRREARREGHRAEEPDARSSSPARSNTTRRSASRSARWRRCSRRRLLEVLREDLGGTYSVTPRRATRRCRRRSMQSTIAFGSEPDAHRGSVKTRVHSRSSCSRRTARPTSRSPT